MELTALPGRELVLKGLADLIQGIDSAEAFLVSIGASRLRAPGIEVPTPLESPEHRLYGPLAAEESDSAHGRYNALVRRLVSFERAADARARWRGESSRVHCAQRGPLRHGQARAT